MPPRLNKLDKAMRKAKTYAEWRNLAVEYDERAGLDRWKRMDQSRRYDYVSIRIRLDRLRALRARHDDVGLLFTLNEGIHGNVAGMGSSSLYGKTRFGTKQLVTDYIDEITLALDHLASPEVEDISFEEKLDFFRRASHCFGRSALMMSGAGTLLYFHLGVIKALWEGDLLPNILSGSSGGAFVASILGTHSPDELQNIFEPKHLLQEIRKEVGIWDNLPSLRRRHLNIDDIKSLLDRLVPDLTFAEAFAKTGQQINISVAPAEPQQTSRLLNAITSPNVFIREALLASSAVPGVYPPVTLAARHIDGSRQPYVPSRKWVDGSVSEDLPTKRLARLYGVNHFIVSQTNPLVLPWVSDVKKQRDPLSVLRHAAQESVKTWVGASAALMRSPLSRRPRLNNMVRMITSVIGQEYTADINILPPTRLFNPLKLLAHRTESEVMAMIRAGEQSTWPTIERIRITTQISRTLDRILNEYEGAVLHHEQLAKFKKAG